MNTKYIWLLIILIGFSACNEPEDVLKGTSAEPEVVVELPELNSGSADFSKYVAVGASYTAGMTDGATFRAGQENSFPKMLSMEFAKIGGGDFVQPLVNDNFGGLAIGGNRVAPPRLVFGGAGPVPLESVIGPVTVTTDITVNNPTGPFNNLGLMGSPKSFHFVAPGYGNIANLPMANPYAIRLTGNTPDASLIDLAVNQNPTFFTLTFFSGNDALSYATSGGDGSEPLTDQTTFDFAFNAAIQQLTANGAKGIVTNMAFPEDLPYFTTVPNNALVLDAATAGQLTGFFQAVAGISSQVFQGPPFSLSPSEAGALAAQYAIPFSEGPNRWIIDVPVTPQNPLGFRQMTEDERLVLTIDRDALAQGYGSVALSNDVLQVLGLLQAGGTPTPEQGALVIGAVNGIDDSDALDSDEIEAMTNAIIGYNNTVEAFAASNENVALLDLNSIFADAIVNGVAFGDFVMTANLVTGGFFSLDGIHPTARGYSYLAFKYLHTIDANFGSNFVASGNIPNPGNYPTNYSPLLQ